MASELPKAPKAKSKRRPLRWQDDHSTDKIYASGTASVIGTQTASDSIARPGNAPAPIPTPVQRADDRSADKYYAQGGSGRTRVAGQKKAANPLLPQSRTVPVRVTATELSVQKPEDVFLVLEDATDRLNGGATGLVIAIPAGRSDLLKRLRAGLDLLVTRQRITEDQSREVRLSYTQPAITVASTKETTAEVVSPTPKESPAVIETPTDDGLAFLDKVEASQEEQPAADDDDGADNDFLLPKMPVVAEQSVLPVEVPAEVPETPEPAFQPKRKPKRSGRGAE